MGTSWQVRVATDGACDAKALGAAIQTKLDFLTQEMSHWDPNSLLGRFNRSPAGSWHALPPDFTAVIDLALTVATRSVGAFDPTLGALVDLWGHGPSGPQPQPSAHAIAHLLPWSGWQRLTWDRAARRLRQPGHASLDLSGIAKGHAVDAVATLLAERGFAHMLVEIGGELAGRGMRPDGEPWWVDLEAVTPALPAFRIALHDMAVATSGTYVRGGHTIDPASGRPCNNDVIAVSILHPSAALADAWASALFVLGSERALAVAEDQGLAMRMVTQMLTGYRETISPALAAMLA
ncbi:FAD:protein FMN transferase [uncultured Sphingomonas sp.]|uniref:FAD:protein FMN transferase n=1 Tax=uncultured Sphingomonas sp. TaxID=158754 RepID=UPI0025F2C0C2|nr:FAD:protein FMN transferase [uncultured Sphingomonas sp.]